jgi:small subunit ribosomal protein S27e
MDTVPKPRGEFLKIKCPDCGNEQNIFDRASTQVNCLVCGATLAKPRGGKAALRGESRPVE